MLNFAGDILERTSGVLHGGVVRDSKNPFFNCNNSPQKKAGAPFFPIEHFSLTRTCDFGSGQKARTCRAPIEHAPASGIEEMCIFGVAGSLRVAARLFAGLCILIYDYFFFVSFCFSFPFFHIRQSKHSPVPQFLPNGGKTYVLCYITCPSHGEVV